MMAIKYSVKHWTADAVRNAESLVVECDGGKRYRIEQYGRWWDLLGPHVNDKSRISGLTMHQVIGVLTELGAKRVYQE
jgi:hypothetical protein